MMPVGDVPQEEDVHASDRDLHERLTLGKPVRVAVIGLGYVGLPLAVRLAEVGHVVIGIDIAPETIRRLADGKSTVEGLTDARVLSVLQSERFQPRLIHRDPEESSAEDLRCLQGTEVFVICVHTPLSKMSRNAPDVQWIEKSANLISRVYAAEEASAGLPRERLLILESTTYPGTTRSLFSQVGSAYKNACKTYLAYSPERINPGPAVLESNATSLGMFQTPKIVGGDTQESGRVAQAFYRCNFVFSTVHLVPGLEAAEFVKLLENSFRYVSIAFALEMAGIAQKMGLNIWEIIAAAKTKGFGLDLCYPGLIGGHCIPIDPIYLEWYARTFLQTDARLITTAQALHDAFRVRAADLICRLVAVNRGNIGQANIWFWGVTYKEDVADTRESAVKDIMRGLCEQGATLLYWDPVLVHHSKAPAFEIELASDEWTRMSQISGARGQIRTEADGGRFLTPRPLSLTPTGFPREVDCVVLAVDHGEFDNSYDLLMQTGIPVIDLRNSIGAYRARLQKRLETGQERQLQEESIRRVDDRIADARHYALLGVTVDSRQGDG